ncbi:50S ribosomal protein L6 [Luteibaculum oceani]|uniref:Large ribosomal subunit protein uL6 n=1 Tax=Luteibaculum oceani TaxID=1294296 RepID=A0A5C6V1Y1_9FLAO|nr:50S ribosomal protein L6 [Luteibaculum oceani]TXC78426.1 50S ribosomal protein L6 [Luteibaculum oceani]
MSRIGKAPIKIESGVDVKISDKNVVTVKGPKGELTETVDPAIGVEVKEGEIIVTRPSEAKPHKAKHGLYRALINNMVEGVTKGYEKKLELVGVGYRAAMKGNVLELALGFSHAIAMYLPSEVKVEVTAEKGKNPIIALSSHDKQLLGQVCAKIRSLRAPEPYKGKGVKFVGEEIRRKAGKSAAKK